MHGDDPHLLTPRQRECIEARQQRRSAKQIGRILGISHHTVHMHWRLARKRLALRDRAQPDANASLARQQQANQSTDADLVILMRQIRIYGRQFFFWVGVLTTTAFVVVHVTEGLMLMAGKRPRHEANAACSNGTLVRPEPDGR
jgi:DNA-binding CsgD family transcriptional regulator